MRQRFTSIGLSRAVAAAALAAGALVVAPPAVAQSARPASTPSWLRSPVPGARGGAQLGAVAGVLAGGYAGLATRCHGGELCALGQMVTGAAVGSLVGSAAGATLGAAWRSGCPTRSSLPARALGGAALWGVPAYAYFGLLRARRRDPYVVFVVAVSLPLLQAEGAARAASSACPAP